MSFSAIRSTASSLAEQVGELSGLREPLGDKCGELYLHISFSNTNLSKCFHTSISNFTSYFYILQSPYPAFGNLFLFVFDLVVACLRSCSSLRVLLVGALGRICSNLSSLAFAFLRLVCHFAFAYGGNMLSSNYFLSCCLEWNAWSYANSKLICQPSDCLVLHHYFHAGRGHDIILLIWRFVLDFVKHCIPFLGLSRRVLHAFQKSNCCCLLAKLACLFLCTWGPTTSWVTATLACLDELSRQNEPLTCKA